MVQPEGALFGRRIINSAPAYAAWRLSPPTEIISMPTIRHADGLAMSSRNKYFPQKNASEPLTSAVSVHRDR
ncbi:pantoate--beta-alanine ligase [Bradyrhizobium yuanmingense]|uniref:pantoate--beta-alanine ligase n=1 Tax=Bradyrhizobium yuanmingense TaxID=108015 RepID=UPI003D2F27D3